FSAHPKSFIRKDPSIQQIPDGSGDSNSAGYLYRKLCRTSTASTVLCQLFPWDTRNLINRREARQVVDAQARCLPFIFYREVRREAGTGFPIKAQCLPGLGERK